MAIHRINQLVANHLKTWGKWPDTEDRDYSSVLAERWEERYVIDGDEYLITNKWYPVYLPYAETNQRPVVAYDWIDNTFEPGEDVLASSLKWLYELSKGCQSLYWWHAWNAWPNAVKDFHALPIMCLHFGDDCPGSTEIKTLPVARFFDSIIYSMYVFNSSNGIKTADIYSSSGVNGYFTISGASCGLEKQIQSTEFDIYRKAASVQNSDRPSIDFSFVGFGGGTQKRCKILQDMHYSKWGDLKIKLHGTCMKDGILEPRLPIENSGAVCADLYFDSLFGVNLQQSSLFTTRMIDLWLCGVVQLMHDPCGELADNGIIDGEHYLSFDGTFDNMLHVINAVKNDNQKLSRLILDGHKMAKHLLATKGPSAAIGRMYSDHKHKL